MGKLLEISEFDNEKFNHIPSDTIIDYYAIKYRFDNIRKVLNLTFEEYYMLATYDRGVNGTSRGA